MTSFSCYWHNATRGWRADRRPIPGARRPFSAATFERLVRCRDLVLVGDSLLLQFWQTLVCLLRRRDTQLSPRWLKRFNEKLCRFGAEHCVLHGGCATFPHMSSRLCYVSDRLLQKPFPAYGLSNTSILVGSTGYHHRTQESFQNAVAAFVGHYVQLPPASRPVVIWSELPAQHFPQHPSGYYQRAWQQYTHCAPVDREAGYAHDWRNRIADSYMKAVGIPILRLWNATQPLWDFHVVSNGRTANAEPDCTHYCLPGPTLQWAVVLTDLLETIGTPIGAACHVRKQQIAETQLFPVEPETKKPKTHRKK
eukprot:EG_transcript_16307